MVIKNHNFCPPSWMKEVIASSIFVLPTADALPCICFSKNKQCDYINSFDQDMVLMVSTLWENKRNKSRKSFHGSRRGLGFHLELNFQCNQMATTINMMFFHFTCLLIIQFFPIEQESNILPEQVHVHTIWHTSPPPKKKQYPCITFAQYKTTAWKPKFILTQSNWTLPHDWVLFPAVFLVGYSRG